MAGTKVRGITIELSADASGVQSALRDVNSALKTTQSDLRDIEKLLKLDPSNTELLAQKQNALQKALSETKDKLEILRQAEEDLKAQMVDGGTEEQQRQLEALQREIISTEADMKKYEGQLEETTRQSEDFGEKTEVAEKKTINFGETAKKVGQVAAAAFAAIAAAMVGVVKGLADLITETAEYGDKVNDMSQKMGMTTDAYQEWDFILNHVGSSVDNLKTSMKTLATAAETGNEAFERLGITQEELANLSQEDLFARTVESLQNVEDTTERTYLASKLLGKGATELGGLFNMTAAETEDLKKKAHELGMVMSEEDVAAADAFSDTLYELQSTFSGIKRSLASEFLPSITKTMDGLTQILIGNRDEGLAIIQEGVDELIQTINESLPTFIEIGGQIIIDLLTGIVENLPELVPAMVDVVLKLVDTLIENLPTIIEAAMQIIIAIIKGIAEALPDLIPKIVEVVLTIVETLIDNIDLLIEAAIELIVALAIGLVKAIPVLIEKGPEIIVGIVKGIISGIGQIIEAGWRIVQGLWEGIKSGAGWLWEKVTGWLNNLWSNIKGFFGISSPSKEMAWVGDMLVQGLAGGIEDNADDAVKAADAMMSDVADAIKDGEQMAIDGMTDLATNLSAVNPTVSMNAVVNGGRTGAVATSEAGILDLLSKYLPELVNRDITLDGDKIVGELAPRYNKQFGRMEAMAARGV